MDRHGWEHGREECGLREAFKRERARPAVEFDFVPLAVHPPSSSTPPYTRRSSPTIYFYSSSSSGLSPVTRREPTSLDGPLEALASPQARPNTPTYDTHSHTQDVNPLPFCSAGTPTHRSIESFASCSAIHSSESVKHAVRALQLGGAHAVQWGQQVRARPGPLLERGQACPPLAGGPPGVLPSRYVTSWEYS